MAAVDTSLLRQGNRRALAKAITLIESKLDRDRLASQALIEALLPYRVFASASPEFRGSANRRLSKPLVCI
jgi:putative protein kinase ArgK-like GTPase of G3E family